MRRERRRRETVVHKKCQPWWCQAPSQPAKAPRPRYLRSHRRPRRVEDFTAHYKANPVRACRPERSAMKTSPIPRPACAGTRRPAHNERCHEFPLDLGTPIPPLLLSRDNPNVHSATARRSDYPPCATISATVAVAVPGLSTTTPAAMLASFMASASSRPAPSATASVATTVSPAPTTS